MSWIKLDCAVANHPKTYKLMDALGVMKPTAVGILNLLWIFTMEYAWRDGNLEKFGDSAISRACGWDEEPTKLVKSLQDCEWLDGYIVNDWSEHAGRLIYDRIYNEERRNTPHNTVEHSSTPSRVGKSRVEKNRVEKKRMQGEEEKRGSSPSDSPSSPNNNGSGTETDNVTAEEVKSLAKSLTKKK